MIAGMPPSRIGCTNLTYVVTPEELESIAQYGEHVSNTRAVLRERRSAFELKYPDLNPAQDPGVLEAYAAEDIAFQALQSVMCLVTRRFVRTLAGRYFGDPK